MTPLAYGALVKKLILLPTLFVVLSACGSDDGSTAVGESLDTTASTAAEPAPTAPPATSPEALLSAECDVALTEAEAALAGVLDTLDQAETTGDLESVDPDELGAAFQILGQAVGTGCTESDLDGGVSRLITFTFSEGSTRSDASADFVQGFLPELCALSQTLTTSAVEACEAIASS